MDCISNRFCDRELKSAFEVISSSVEMASRDSDGRCGFMSTFLSLNFLGVRYNFTYYRFQPRGDLFFSDIF